MGQRALRRNPVEIAHHVRLLSRKGRVAFAPGEEVVDYLDGHVPAADALFGGLLRSPAESTSPVIADRRKVPSIHARVGGEHVAQIGRATCRERVSPYGWLSGIAET